VAAWWLGAPGAGLDKAVWLIGAVAWYPVLYGLQYGQPALVVLLTVVACWRLAEGGKPYLAGLALAVGTSFKPQLVLAVPLVLLLGGRWRIVAAWIVASGALAALSLLTLGATGLGDYRSLLAEAQTLPNNRYFTWAYVLGPGALSYVTQAVILIAAAAGAYLNRHGSTGRLLALGILAGAAGATYWHLQDFTVLVGAAWLFWRDNPPAWQRMWMAVTAVTIELAWPLTPLPLLIATAVWLGFLVYPARKAMPAPA
jgi:Glycosyltransferase family 87